MISQKTRTQQIYSEAVQRNIEEYSKEAALLELIYVLEEQQLGRKRPRFPFSGESWKKLRFSKS